MRVRPRRARAVVLAILSGLVAARGAPQPAEDHPRTIRESVDPAVAEFIREHSPCDPATGGDVPCFPVLVEVKAPEYSVKGDLDRNPFDHRPMPGPPTPEELSRFGANPLPASGTVSFDPICKTKQLVRKIFGRGRTYYVYRVWDHTGERAVLREEPLDPAEFAGAPRFQYESVGQFGDECDAIKAYLKVTHDLRMAREASGGEGSVELGSDRPE